jgi:hypothetical protein
MPDGSANNLKALRMAASDDLGTRIMRLRNKAEQMRVLAESCGISSTRLNAHDRRSLPYTSGHVEPTT